MFNFDFLKKFKSSTSENNTSSNTLDSSDNLYIELSSSYIAYRLNDEDINVVDFPIKTYDNFEMLLNLWLEAINVIVETLKIKPNLTFLLNSSDFIVKNSEKKIDENSYTKYFASKLALDEDDLEVKHLCDTSYLIIEYKFIQKILFKFKDYTIKNIYDTALVNTFYLKPNGKHLYMDLSFNSFDILLHDIKIQKRSFDTNLFTLIDECSKALYTDHDTAYQNILMSFKDIETYEELKEYNKPLQKNIIAFIDHLMDQIKNTISYFSIYENIDNINRIYVNGDILEFSFILKILSKKFEVNFVPLSHELKLNTVAKSNLTVLQNIDRQVLKRQEISFEGLHYSDGRDEYVFIENKFVSKGKLSATQRVRVDAKQNKISLNNSDDYILDELNKPILKMDMGELYLYIKSRFFKNENLNQLEKSKKGIFYISGVVVVLITLLVLFNMVSESQREFSNQINTLEDRTKRVDNLKKQIIAQNRALNLDMMDKKVDKIFWTQKFITLANLMPNEIWLSSISMTNLDKEIEGKEVVSQAMILEARALPSSIGHITNIANYMNSLLNANDDFRKDFSNIYFGGAEMISEYGYDVINFKLLCNFEKNIQIKNIQEENVSTKDKSITQNLQSINKNTQLKEDVLNNIGKGQK